MTIEQLLEWARAASTESQSSYRESDAARAILELLGESQPCGYEAPKVHAADGDDGIPLIELPDYSGLLIPDDVRAIGRMCFRAADECDALPDEIEGT